MFQTSVVLLSLLLMVGALMAHRRHAGTASAPRKHSVRASAAARAIVKARVQAPPRTAPVAPAAPVAALEWISPQASGAAGPGPEDVRARLRDRYIAVRFHGMAAGAASLRETEKVVNLARLYFEEDKLDRAHELLKLAIELAPAEKALRLAQLEIAYLGRDAALFVILALALRKALPDSPEWEDVCRLGRVLAPSDPLFGAATQDAAPARGQWPEVPNWIQFSMDLTPEALAVDFHRALARRNDVADAGALRRVA